jgi:hypothetical protein
VSAEEQKNIAQQEAFGAQGSTVADAKNILRARIAGDNLVAQYLAEAGMGIGGLTNNPDYAMAGGAALGMMFSNEVGGTLRSLEEAANDLRDASKQLKGTTAPPRTAAQRAEATRHEEN